LPEEAEKRIVFARLRPEHKLDIIKALRARSIYTAMIGDGVNDVPAIKSADLGVAMEDGAAITREIADVVLLKNRFTLLPQVFHEGERIIGTVGSIARLFLTKNFAVIYTSLISAIWLLEFPLTPRRVAFLNIFAIGLPAILMAVTNSNTRKPKRFSLDTVSFVTISALVIVGAAYTGLLLARAAHLNPENEDVAEMVMLSILIVTSVVNFLVVVFSGATKKIGYAIYGVLLILVYFLVVNATPANLLIRSAKTFYEISSLDAASWRIVILVCSVSSAVLVIAQRLRSAIVNRNAGEVVPGS
jgi:cation-transporting ATPase E